MRIVAPVLPHHLNRPDKIQLRYNRNDENAPVDCMYEFFHPCLADRASDGSERLYLQAIGSLSVYPCKISNWKTALQ